MADEEKTEEKNLSGTDMTAGEASEDAGAGLQAAEQIQAQEPVAQISEQTSEQVQAQEPIAQTTEQVQAQDGQGKETACPSYDEAFEELYAEILEHFRSFSPSEQVAGQITEEHITEYLEGTREERMLAFKERRERRFLTTLEILGALTAIVLIVWFLKDNPAILVNILYLIGGLGIFFLWKQPHKKE